MNVTINETINDSCIICYNNILEESLCKTNCNHIYCKDCLNKWFDRGNVECPMCRVPVKSYLNDFTNQIKKIIPDELKDLNQYVFYGNEIKIGFIPQLIITLGLIDKINLFIKNISRNIIKKFILVLCKLKFIIFNLSFFFKTPC